MNSKATRDKRSRRKKRDRASVNPPLSVEVAEKRPFAPASVLTEAQIDLVHEYSMRVLEEIGLEFMLPEAWDILEQSGAIVDRDTGLTKMPRSLVESSIAKAPSKFQLVSANPVNSFTIGGDNIRYGSVASAPNVLDTERGRRPGDFESFRDLLKISHQLDTCTFMSGYPVEPVDVAVNVRHLECYREMLTLTDKPFRIYAIGETRVTDALEMIGIAHQIDRDELKRHPRTLTNLNVNSPLKVDGPLLTGAIQMALNKQIVVVTPVAFAGAMSPITLSGSLVQFNAECLGVIAFLQMLSPGTPVMYGTVISNIDMKSGAPTFGTPEMVTGMIATGQLARRYDVPMRGYLCSSSKAVDAQAAYETEVSLWANILAGVHLVFHAHGFLDAALISSYEKAVLDADLIGMMQATPPTIDFSDLDEAFEAIRDVGPGGHYLGAAHTMERYRTAFYRSSLSDWQPYEHWVSSGSVETSERARDAWHSLLDGYTKPDIEPEIRRLLDEFVERRRREIGSDELT